MTLSKQEDHQKRMAAHHECFLDDVQAVLKQPAGRRMIRRILEMCDVRGPVAGTESTMHYREGQRSLGRWLENAVIERQGSVVLAQVYEEFV